ncbi:MAG: methyltransferase domain-containing protein [Candidatus Omnitrophica bacterium]|nr:methyltransferase domain-containing protein [Candidatus Omnitrophota bacterium]
MKSGSILTKRELKNYFAKDLGWGWFRKYQAQLVFNFLIDAAEFCKDGVILDAGAGHQRYKPFFQDSIYITQEHQAGIDMKNMQDIEHDLISPLYEKIPLKENVLDGVLSTSTLEHIRYPDRFIREACRVLKPGGKLFINCPFCHPEHETPYDFNRPTSFGLERWFRDAGFEEFTIKPSSSCTETACAFFAVSLWHDIRRSDKRGRELLSEALKSKNGYLKVISKAIHLCYAKCVYLLAALCGNAFRLLVDRGANDSTTLPVGWIAVAVKPGKFDKSIRFKNKIDFLAKCKNE